MTDEISYVANKAALGAAPPAAPSESATSRDVLFSAGDLNDDCALDLQDVRRARERGGVRFELHIPRARVRRGSFVVVVGESGSGKSTLLDMLGLALRPDSAQKFMLRPKGRDAVDVADLWRRRDENALADLRRVELGYVLQTGGLFPFLTVAENIALQARLQGAPASAQAVRDAAERLNIAGVLTKKPAALSGGQRQRAAIARALLHNPAIVLADEPTAAVDRPRAQRIFKDLNALAKERGVAVIVVTHAPDLARPYADCVFEFELAEVNASLTRSVCLERAL